MRPSALLLSLVVAAATLLATAAGRINYYKGLTTVADLESLRLLDDEGRFRKHTLVSFLLPDTDGSSACALEQLGTLRFPHLFFHLPGAIFEMIQVFVDPATELTQSLLPNEHHVDACRSFLFIPQNSTVAGAADKADAEGRRLVAHSQRELEGWFWGLQCAATGSFAFKNDFTHMISIYRETRQPRKLEMERVGGDEGGSMGSEWGAKSRPEMELLLMDVAPGERVVLNATHPICRGHTAVFRRWGGRMFARLVVGDEDMLPLSFVPSSANSSEETDLTGTVTALGLRAKGSEKPPAWDPRRLQLTQELAELYQTRAEYNFKRLERIEHAPRRIPALSTEGYTKQRVPQGTWEMLLQMYNDALEERKSTPEPKPAQILRIENDRVPLPTVVLRHRNANPMPVSTVMGPFLKQNTTEWQTMVDEIIPRMEAWTGRTGLKAVELTKFRRYYNGSMLRDHVDGGGDVSLIINMAQETNEPWELHTLDHQGRRHRVVMEPGDMVIYQPQRLAHGRPLPVSGSFYDNIFLRVVVEDVEKRPLTPTEAALEGLVLQELPLPSEGQLGDDEVGMTTEL